MVVFQEVIRMQKPHIYSNKHKAVCNKAQCKEQNKDQCKEHNKEQNKVCSNQNPVCRTQYNKEQCKEHNKVTKKYLVEYSKHYNKEIWPKQWQVLVWLRFHLGRWRNGYNLGMGGGGAQYPTAPSNTEIWGAGRFTWGGGAAGAQLGGGNMGGAQYPTASRPMGADRSYRLWQ